MYKVWDKKFSNGASLTIPETLRLHIWRPEVLKSRIGKSFVSRLSEKSFVVFRPAASRPNIFYPEIHDVDLWQVSRAKAPPAKRSEKGYGNENDDIMWPTTANIIKFTQHVTEVINQIIENRQMTKITDGTPPCQPDKQHYFLMTNHFATPCPNWQMANWG